eukprot:gene4476-3269_t
MNADERNPALIIFWLITIGYITSTICEEILGTFYFLREELALQHQLHQLQAEKNNISTTELSRRGRLERKEISVRQDWQRLRQLRLRYTVSLSSILFIFDVAPCEIPCSIFGRVASSYIPRGKRLNVVEHLGLLLTYNATTARKRILFVFRMGVGSDVYRWCSVRTANGPPSAAVQTWIIFTQIKYDRYQLSQSRTPHPSPDIRGRAIKADWHIIFFSMSVRYCILLGLCALVSPFLTCVVHPRYTFVIVSSQLCYSSDNKSYRKYYGVQTL